MCTWLSAMVAIFLCIVLPLLFECSNAIVFLLFARHSLRCHTSTFSFSPEMYLCSTSTITNPSPCWFSNHLVHDKRTAGSHHVTRWEEQTCTPDYAKIPWVRFTQLGTPNVSPLFLSGLLREKTTAPPFSLNAQAFLSGTAPY
jgi:hypothetical protein